MMMMNSMTFIYNLSSYCAIKRQREVVEMGKGET